MAHNETPQPKGNIMTEQVIDITTLPKNPTFTPKRLLIAGAVVGTIAAVALIAKNRLAVEEVLSDVVSETPKA